jgi:hypothetical protein
MRCRARTIVESAAICARGVRAWTVESNSTKSQGFVKQRDSDELKARERRRSKAPKNIVLRAGFAENAVFRMLVLEIMRANSSEISRRQRNPALTKPLTIAGIR